MLFGIVHVRAIFAHKTVYGDRRGIIAADSHYLILDAASYIRIKRPFRAKKIEMSTLGQKRPFWHGQPYGRFAPEVDIQWVGKQAHAEAERNPKRRRRGVMVNPCTSTEKATTANEAITISLRIGMLDGNASARASARAPRKPPHHRTCCSRTPIFQRERANSWLSG